MSQCTDELADCKNRNRWAERLHELKKVIQWVQSREKRTNIALKR